MNRAVTATLTRRVQGWQLLLALGVVAIVTYYLSVRLGHAWAGARVALYASGDATVAVIAVAAGRRHRPLRLAMFLVALSALATVAGDVIFNVLAQVESEVTYPSLADAFFLLRYPILVAGLLVVVRKRTPGWDGASAIDAGIVAVSAGFLVYIFVIAPTMQVTVGNIAILASVAYPVGDLMLITVGARLMLGAGPRTPALAMLGVQLVMFLFANSTYSLTILNGTYRASNFLDGIWMGASFVLAAGVAHPSAPRLLARASTIGPDATARRLSVLAVAAVLAPTGMVVQHLRGEEPHILIAGAVCNVLFLLVLARMAGLVRMQRHAATTDGLTGLRSRRWFEEMLRAEVARATRGGSLLSVLLLDIDHFKAVNDTFGHAGGDRVLIEVAHRLSGLVRPGDQVARYGGEEFAVLLSHTGATEAREIAERVRRGVAADPIAVGENRQRRVTVSVGVAGMPVAGGDAADLVLSADRALYAAKDAGRDRVTAAA